MFALPLRSQLDRKPNRSRRYRPRIEWMEPKTLLSAVTWTGKGGDNNWDTAANWSTDSVPGKGDDVTIDIAANVVHSNDVSDSINSLTSTEPLTISGGTLSIAAASTINNTLSITGGTLTGAGDVTVSGLVTLTSGTLSGSGALNANGGMLINPTGEETGFNLDGRTVNNAAGQTATWSGGLDVESVINASDGSVFNNQGTFVFDAFAAYNAGSGAAPTFNNTGSITVPGPVGLVGMDVPFNMTGGSVDIQANGQLDLDGGGSSTGGTFDIESDGGALEPSGYSFGPTTTITGAGSLATSGVQILPGNYSFTGSTFIENTTLQVDGSLAGSVVSFSDFGNDVLSGTGTVGGILAEGGDGGAVSPGDGTSPGILTVNGDVQLTPPVPPDSDEGVGSAFDVVLNGPDPGTGYSQLVSTDAVDLNGCDFNPQLGFTPADGEQFTIIKSDAPIGGTFDQLPEGASLTINNVPFTISYQGDDVVLTQAVAPAALTVTAISPNSGPSAGGTLVTITGSGFTGATAVDFGTTAATNVTVESATTITADSPAGSGAVDVTVVTPGGTSANTSADRFTYTVAVPAPTVTGISPKSGPSAGGTLVTITGSGFTGATAVDFGATATTNFTVVNATTISATSPAGSGAVDIAVVTPHGISGKSAVDRFTYTASGTSPTVTSVNRFGVHMQPTSIVLTFSAPLDPITAEDVNNYKIVTLGGPGRGGNLVGHVTPVRAAIYDPSSLTVTLYPVGRLDFHNVYRLTVEGATPSGVKSATGVPLGGQGNGDPGHNYVTTVTSKNLVLTPAEARKYLHPKARRG
jgi:hypothetical protein